MISHDGFLPGRYCGKTWAQIVHDFRLWSFRRYYEKFYANEPDNTLRFGKSIAASSQPIRNERLVLKWHRMRAAEQIRKDQEKRRRLIGGAA